MSFLQKYKRLDNLCKDVLRSEKGVTSYIEEMELCNSSSFKIPGWKEDYYNLKKYRHIRNRIVHENDVDEAMLCSKKDEMWIEQFYTRILKRNDPLALYAKFVRPAYKTRKERDTENNTGTRVIALMVIIAMMYVLYHMV